MILCNVLKPNGRATLGLTYWAAVSGDFAVSVEEEDVKPASTATFCIAEPRFLSFAIHSGVVELVEAASGLFAALLVWLPAGVFFSFAIHAGGVLVGVSVSTGLVWLPPGISEGALCLAFNFSIHAGFGGSLSFGAACSVVRRGKSVLVSLQSPSTDFKQ